jgi:hypothetical protein
MSVTTIAGHVLFPHRPDWRTRVDWTRTWDTVIRDSVVGTEQRLAMRPRGRVGLKFRFMAFDDVEHHLFQDRLREALKVGRIAVPFFGRGIRLAQSVNSGVSLLPITEEPNWEWSAADILWIGHPVSSLWNTWETVELTEFPGDGTAVLAAPTANQYPAGTRVYPLLYGRADMADAELLDDWRGAYTVRVEETVTRPTPSVP